MLFFAKKSSGVRGLSAAHSDALGHVHSTLPRRLDKHAETVLNKQLMRNLMDAHDSGERDPDALRRAALRGVVALKSTP